MLPYDCEMCEDAGSYLSFKVADGARGGRGRIVQCDHGVTS